MAKKTPFFAIAVCSVMMLSSNANASFLATLIDAGIDAGISISKSVANKIGSLMQDKQKKSDAKLAVPVPTAKPTPKQVENAWSELSTECRDISSKGIPCATGYGRGCEKKIAKNIAYNDAIQKFGQSINSYVQGEIRDSIIQIVEGGGIELEREEFASALKSTVDAKVYNVQEFLSYEYKRERGLDNCKVDSVYVVEMMVVMNLDLFNQAVVESSFEEEIGKKIINESIKGIANKVSGELKRKKK